MSNFLGGIFGGEKAADRIGIKFDGETDRKKRRLGSSAALAEAASVGLIAGGAAAAAPLPIFGAAEAVSGEVEVRVKPGQKLDHQGIKIEMVGAIDLYHDRSNSTEFTQLVRELEPAGSLATTKRYEFDFSAVEKPYESYLGLNVRLRYFVRVTVARGYGSVVFERDFVVQCVQAVPELTNSIKMEVGIEECLHIEFEYAKHKFHLDDIIIGKVYFLLVRIKIKHMELALIRREQIGSGASAAVQHESESITKFELMDGAPVRGECVPIRCFLSQLDVTPTYRNGANKFTVKYFLNLVLVDAEDRRYFKQHEITLWRKEIA